MDHLREGAIAPDFRLSDLSGRPFHLVESLAGGMVVLVFLKTSCPTCHLTFPYLERIQAHYFRSRPPRLWAVSQDPVGDTRDFARELNLGMPFLVDPHPFRVSDDYAVHYVPTIYLIDRDRTIRIADYGFSKPALRRLDHDLAERLGTAGAGVIEPGDRRPERRPGCSSNN